MLSKRTPFWRARAKNASAICSQSGTGLVAFSSTTTLCTSAAGMASMKCTRVLPTQCDEASPANRSEEHTSELQSRGHLVCRLLLEKKNKTIRKKRTAKRIQDSAY